MRFADTAKRVGLMTLCNKNLKMFGLETNFKSTRPIPHHVETKTTKNRSRDLHHCFAHLHSSITNTVLIPISCTKRSVLAFSDRKFSETVCTRYLFASIAEISTLHHSVDFSQPCTFKGHVFINFVEFFCKSRTKAPKTVFRASSVIFEFWRSSKPNQFFSRQNSISFLEFGKKPT